MPITPNEEFQRLRPIPDGLLPNTEVFYLSSTNEVFLDYDDYFERMIQLNSSCWHCSVTGRSGMTYDEALECESDAIKRRKKREETKSKKAILSPNATGGSKAADETSARKKRQIHEQQQQLEPLFRQAEKAGVEQMERWRQSRRLLNDSHIVALRETIQAAKEAERKRQVERQRREREALAEWRKPRDDLLCEDLKPFPEFKALRWPDWVPREHYWDILAISSFCQSFAPLLNSQSDDQQRRSSMTFGCPQIATALVSRQISGNSSFYLLLESLLNALEKCNKDDDGNAADLTNPDQIGNEVVKDYDHPVHGHRIQSINRECQRQLKLHGVNVWELARDCLDISEIIRLLLTTAGFYTKWRRQTRGFMHCYEDDGFIFVQQHPEIVELLEKVSVYALNPTQRVQLITNLMDQLLSHSSFRKLIDDRIDELAELRKRLKQLKAVDQQHEKEVRDALQHIQQQQQQKDQEEQQLVDKDEQKTHAVAQRELVLLRRALTQLNEGRRVKDVGDLRERLVDAQRPLPWRVMDDAREVHEFRAVQRTFHLDRVQELLREIYQLQSRMGMFLLGRDRAFRSYYYMNSAFIILCPGREELSGGHCWGEKTPKAKTTAALGKDSGTETDGEGDEADEDKKERRKDGPNRTLMNDVSSKQTEERRSCSAVEDNKTDISGRRETEKERKSVSSGEDGGEKKHDSDEPLDCSCSPPLDSLMACTGGDGMEQCPVHNPPHGWPQLLIYAERDGVEKLFTALNLRGFRETELADSISLFRDFYKQEMDSFFDSSGTAVPNLGAHLFGFGRGMPKELKESALSELDLFNEARVRLLTLEEELHDRGIGPPYCSTGREEWRASLETYGDTSMLCRGNCIPLIRSPTPTGAIEAVDALNMSTTSAADHFDNTVGDEEGVHGDQQQQQMHFLYTREELSTTSLSKVQKLGIALMQLVHGIRRDFFYNNFIRTAKKNGVDINKPTDSFVNWQLALKECQSPSAFVLFQATLEASINSPLPSQNQKNVGGRRRRMPRGGSAKTEDDNTENGNETASAAATPSTSSAQHQRQYARHRLEVNNLLMEASYLGGMAIGARKRKPVTKYGDVEMDVDKLNFDDDDEEEEEEEDEREEEQQEDEEEERAEEEETDEEEEEEFNF